MPTDFLKDRYTKFLSETSGTTTIGYISFNASSIDPVTGDVDEALSYGGVQVKLPARIDNYPSKSLRALTGLNISFDSVLRLSSHDLQSNSIDPKIGDAVILPHDNKKRYVVKVVRRKQSSNEFIEVILFVSRNVKSRG